MVGSHDRTEDLKKISENGHEVRKNAMKRES